MLSIIKKIWFGEISCIQCGKKFTPIEQIDGDKYRVETCSSGCYIDYTQDLMNRHGC